MRQPFVCPHCKSETGWKEETPVRASVTSKYDEYGNKTLKEDISVYCTFKTRYYCLKCKEDITKSVEKYLKIIEVMS